MIVNFSSQIPLEANSIKENFLPFKTFVIETSEKVQDEKFFKKRKRTPKTLLPKCTICDMHFNIFSLKSKKDMWVCNFCHSSNVTQDISLLNVTSKYLLQEENFKEEPLAYSSINQMKNLVILILDMSIFMENLIVGSQELSYNEWISLFIERDLSNIPLGSNFCLLLCNDTIEIIGNYYPSNSCPRISYPDFEYMKQCLTFGRKNSSELFYRDKCDKIIKKIRSKKLNCLSSLGAGLAISLGILKELNPLNNKIIMIGDGACHLGFGRTKDLGDSREDSLKELSELKNIIDENINDLNLFLYDFGCENSDNIFLNIKKIFKSAKHYQYNNDSDLEMFLNLSLLQDKKADIENSIRVAISPNLVLIPYDNLKDNKFYNFKEKKKGVFNYSNINSEKCLYPFHFEFSTNTQIQSKDRMAVIQVEYIKKQNNKRITFLTTKKLEIVKFKDIDYSFFNFTVPNFCYYANGFLDNKEKIQGYLILINDYLSNKQKQDRVLRHLKNYIEKQHKKIFDLKIPIEHKEESLRLKKKEYDFNYVERVSQKKITKKNKFF